MNKRIVIIAGPNGAGKTTVAREFLPNEAERQPMKTPVSRLNDPDMQAAPVALMRAAATARRLAERTGTRFVVRPPAIVLNEGLRATSGTEPNTDGSASLAQSGSCKDQSIGN